MDARLAYSKKGHDKGRLYAVIAEDERFVYLADGTYRSCDHPKKKNRVHIQPVTHLPEEIRELLRADHPDRDTAVKRAIRLFTKQEDLCQKQM